MKGDDTFGTDPAGTPTPTGEVFGHSETTLYRIDTNTQQLEAIGDFNGCTYVADIALDADSNIYASTGSALYYVETNTAHCTKIADGTFPNSLSFVPVGAIDATSETLVGFQGGDYVKIEPRTGKVTKLGSIGNGLESSGDVVSTKEKTYVSVKGKDCSDCLAEINPANGALVKNWGSLGHPDVFGLAFWGGKIYGFTNAGEVFSVELDAGALVVTNLAIKPDVAFWGAGSTTAAPLGPVH